MGELIAFASVINKTAISGPSLATLVAQIKIHTQRINFFSRILTAPPEIPSAFAADTSSDYFTSFNRAQFQDTTASSYNFTQYIVNSKSKRKDSVTFRVNKLYRILPFVGLSYSYAEDPEVTLNSDGTIDKVNYFDGTSIIMGLKVYPFGATPIYDSKFIISTVRRPHIDYRKLNLTLGVDVKQPLKQFYLGVGIDLWSGVSLSGGFHGIDKTQDKIVNYKVDSQRYLDCDNFYFSLNIDASVAIKLIDVLKK